MNIVFLLFGLSNQAAAVVIRHDVDDARYRVQTKDFSPLVDFPREGHGVLISDRWILRAAHVIQGPLSEVNLNGTPRSVKRVIVHPRYKPLSPAVVAAALESRNATEAMRGQISNDDVALVELAQPATDVAPALIMRAPLVSGELVQILGKGATGNGAIGQHGVHRTELRRAFSHLSSVDDKWLTYRFHGDGAAHPLEGMSGSGDSGGPLLVQSSDGWKLAGIAVFKYVEGDPTAFKPGVYGQLSYNFKVSYYLPWIAQVTDIQEPEKAQ